jgi:hypothetical protein
MVVNYPNFVSLCLPPLKDEAPALIDSHAVIASKISFEEFEAVPRW